MRINTPYVRTGIHCVTCGGNRHDAGFGLCCNGNGYEFRGEAIQVAARKERHGGPADRGSADAYYGRARDPHYYKGHTYSSERVEKAQMTEQEIADYNEGYDNQTDRKDWE